TVLDQAGSVIKSKSTAAKTPRLRLAPVPSPAPAVYDKRNPCMAEVLENTCLSHPDRQGAIWHMVLAGEGRLELQPGDAIGVLPVNDAPLVEEILSLAQLDGGTPVRVAEQDLPLREALRHHLDLVVPGKALLE